MAFRAGPVGGERPPYPVETLRYVYMTPFGGFSPDLEPGEIGIRADALAHNTHLRAEDVVTISKPEGSARIPFILKMLFRVRPIDDGLRDAWQKSADGEAVLPHEQPGQPSESARLDLARGEEIVINGVLARRFGWQAGT